MRKSSFKLLVLLVALAINQSYGEENVFAAKISEPFGQSLFVDTFDAAEESPRSDRNTGVLPDYILKPHDEVNIDIWGSLDLHYALTITTDGYIIVPEAGRVSLGGLTYSEAKKKILNHLAHTYAFFINAKNPGAGKAHVDITLGKTAGINVFVSGEVKKHGNININGINASVINILKKSGINDQASLRNIQLKKLNGKIYTFDLYDFLLKGNLPTEFKYLNDNDIIFVPPRDKEVNITGAIRRPGVYELLPTEKLSDAVRIAGGLLPEAQGKIKIFRVKYGNIEELSATLESDCVLADNDIIDVAAGDNSNKFRVIIDGEVKNPGKYLYVKHEKINDFIKRCGGLNDDAFLEGAEFYRNGALVLVDLAKAFNEPDSKFNFYLSPGDKITIPPRNNFIMVTGAVISPVSIFFKEGEDVDYYIKMAGGYKDNADKDNVRIIFGGSVTKAYQGFWSFSSAVPFGAKIEIPEKSNE